MKIIELKENYLKFDNGYIIEGIHEQDCCESVYADFEYLKLMNINPSNGQPISITDIEFTEDIENCIKLVPETGFKLIAKEKYGDYTSWLVPCYNYQNGYYNSCLELKITKDTLEIIVDISKCVEDHIY